MIKAILFDLDGVLVDSYEYTIITFQRTLAHFNYKAPQRKDLEKLLGLTAYGILEILLPQSNEQQLSTAYEQFKIESDKAIPMIKLFNDVDTIIEKLSKKYTLGIVSNRRTYSVHNLLKHHNTSV